MSKPRELAASYAHCRGVVRAVARNFYYGISLLPAPKRDALCAIYAFMREADDISDAPGDLDQKRRRLAAWRASLERALEGKFDAHPAWPAFHRAVTHFAIPPQYLHELISGTEMDLTVREYATFESLREYCYRVAGCVGLTCIHVFGFSDSRALPLAERLGIAFQLTNILRDLREDFALGRVYLPQEDLARFGIVREALAGDNFTPALSELVQFEAERARSYYLEGIGLLDLVSPDSRAALWALARIYSGLLGKMEDRGYDVFSSRVALTAAEKTWIMLRARLGWWSKDDVLEERHRNRRRSGGTVVGRRAG